MTTTVDVPVWVMLLVAVLAAIAALDRILVPSVRWFLRRRMERLVARLNTRLKRPIHPFRLLGRNDMIVRLSHDPAVMQAVVDHARDTGVPESVAWQEARRYAREIAPGFSALVYFGFATRAARWISKIFYRVEVGNLDSALDGVDPNATVVFVMNHRSNMDYVLITWLIAGQSAISFAVGEWARIWPLSWLFRAMGAYFIRRGSRNTLYRRVLARYVQITAADGTTQAMFPEGGLSLDGRVGAAKLGLLGYLVGGMNEGARDVVFVPVGIAYDRVLEDRVLTETAKRGDGMFSYTPVSVLGFLARTLWRVLRRRFPGFGVASVGFGAPLSLRSYMTRADWSVTQLGAELTKRMIASIPPVGVPLVAAAVADGAMTASEVAMHVDGLLNRLPDPHLIEPARRQGLVSAGIRLLHLRGILTEDNGAIRVAPGKVALASYYSASTRQAIESRDVPMQAPVSILDADQHHVKI